MTPERGRTMRAMTNENQRLNRKLALWALVAALALLLLAGSQIHTSVKAQSPVPNPQYRLSNPQSPRTITYTYDDAGRLTRADYGGGTGLNYVYDAAGNLLGVTAGGYNVHLPLVLRAK